MNASTKFKLEQAIQECEEKKLELEHRLGICTSEVGKQKIEKSIAKLDGQMFAYTYVITDLLPTE